MNDGNLEKSQAPKPFDFDRFVLDAYLSIRNRVFAAVFCSQRKKGDFPVDIVSGIIRGVGKVIAPNSDALIYPFITIEQGGGAVTLRNVLVSPSMGFLVENGAPITLATMWPSLNQVLGVRSVALALRRDDTGVVIDSELAYGLRDNFRFVKMLFLVIAAASIAFPTIGNGLANAVLFFASLFGCFIFFMWQRGLPSTSELMAVVADLERNRAADSACGEQLS